MVAAISERMGRPPMPHQRYVWDVGLEVQSEAAGDPNPGEWAYDEALWTVQRQTGKTTGVRPLIVHRCGSIPGARVFMTAQKRDKARARWMDATDDLLTSSLGLGVKRKIGVGHEELRWARNLSTFTPFAPNEEDLHGETPDLVLADEWWAFGQEQAEAIEDAVIPGFTTKAGQFWKLSTAGTARSWALNRDRREGRRAVERGTRLGVAHFEWGLPDVVTTAEGRRVKIREDLELDLPTATDEELVLATIEWHPARGFTLRESAVWAGWRQLKGHLDRSAFLRAYGNRTARDETPRWRVIDEETFLRGTGLETIPVDAPVALGFDVDPERRTATVSAAWRSPSGRMVTELLRHEVGAPRWVAAYVLERWAKPGNKIRAVGVNNAGPSRDVADELERAGMELVRLSETDYAAACQRHADTLGEEWVHDGHPDLVAAASTVGWRNVGRSRAWNVVDDPITALSSSTLAGWAWDAAPAPEPERSFWMG